MSATDRPPAPAGVPAGLRPFNLAAAALHAVQAVLMVVLSTGLTLSVTATFATGPPGQAPSGSQLEELFAYPLGPAVALFLALSAVFHLLVASPWGWPRYQRELAKGQNRFRWVEYSLSASLMIVLIAGITGITDVAALLAIFGANAAMILFGWLMETKSAPGPGADWSPFVFGCIVGAVPWLAVLVYLVGPAEVPGFVYGIFVSLFVLFNCFAINQWLQYRQIGPWRDYLFGERTYIVLSLVAKSLLAWQVFVNVLIPD